MDIFAIFFTEMTLKLINKQILKTFIHQVIDYFKQVFHYFYINLKKFSIVLMI